MKKTDGLKQNQAAKSGNNNQQPKSGSTTKNVYSDEELQEFKEIIVNKLTDAVEDLEFLTEKPNDTSDTDSQQVKTAEDGARTLHNEQTGKLVHNKTVHIISLENALVRIKNKTYGKCQHPEHNHLIPKERLRVVPHATLCVDAKNKQDRKK